MAKCATRHPADWREGRRLRAWELKQQGWSQRRSAEALGVTPGAVSQWMRRRRAGGGREALYRRPPPGPTPKLTAVQRAQLPALLARGAEAYGFTGNVWTHRRIAAAIRRELGVRYHPASLTRLLRRPGWSPQQPRTRATQRDEAVIRAWSTRERPALSAKPALSSAPHLKYVELRNLCCPTPWDLDHEVRLAARRLRRTPHVIQACFTAAGGV
jgi:transposase